MVSITHAGGNNSTAGINELTRAGSHITGIVCLSGLATQNLHDAILTGLKDARSRLDPAAAARITECILNRIHRDSVPLAGVDLFWTTNDRAETLLRKFIADHFTLAADSKTATLDRV